MNTTVSQAKADMWTQPSRCEGILALGSSLCKPCQPSQEIRDTFAPLPSHPSLLPASRRKDTSLSPLHRCDSVSAHPRSVVSQQGVHPSPSHTAGKQVSDWGCGMIQTPTQSHRLQTLHLSLRDMFVEDVKGQIL